MRVFLWDVLSPLTARNGSAHSLYLLLHTLVETIADSFTLGSVLLSPAGPSPKAHDVSRGEIQWNGGYSIRHGTTV